MIRPGVTGLVARPSQPRIRAMIAIALVWLVALASPALAQTFPELTGRVVDAANVLPDDAKARLDTKLTAIEEQSQRQFVVVTLPDLQGYDIADYGYQLGRHWQIGDKQRNDGVLLIVAPKERKVRIEVGYGLEPILTDGLTSLIVQNDIVPRFKAGDMPGGIEAGADAVIRQLTLPPEEAQKIAAQARPKKQEASPLPGFIFLAFFLLVFVLPAIMRNRRGSRFHSDGLAPIIVWSVLDSLNHGSGRSGGSGFGGGGGFSGGGGSFGGGGASGGW